MIRMVISLFLLTLLALGCSKKVEFTQVGQPICPYCKAKVKPHTEFCMNCKKNFRWSDQLVKCWNCEGTHICPSCHGSGEIFNAEGSREKCSYCNGTGYCAECDENGDVEFGNSPVPVYSRR